MLTKPWNRTVAAVLLATGVPLATGPVMAEEYGAKPAQPPRADAATPAPRDPLLGRQPVALATLADSRGGAQVLNEMKLNGVVADNQASHLATGNNAVTEGAFSNAAGLPMVIQNSGNNVLIQNATILNVQLN